MNESFIGKVVNRAIEGLAIIGFAGLIIMMLLGVWGCLANWIGFAAPGVVEWSEVLNVMVICLPMTYVTLKRKHIEIDVVTTYLRPRPKGVLYVATLFPFLFFSALLAWQLTPQAMESLAAMEYVQPGPGIKIWWWPGKLAVAIGFIGTAMANLYMLIGELRKKKMSEPDA